MDFDELMMKKALNEAKKAEQLAKQKQLENKIQKKKDAWNTLIKN